MDRAPIFAVAVIAGLSISHPALAQRAGENAVNAADDAFGSSVGLETTGIYSDSDTRGFSPTKAGNVRIDGVYYDPVGVLSGRLRQSTAIRIGFAAEDYPFQAPTGIVDQSFRPFPKANGASIGANLMGYMGTIGELDLRIRSPDGAIGFTGGLAYADNRFADGTWMESYGVTLRPMLRTGGVEIAPWLAYGQFWTQLPRTIAVVTGDFLPKMPPRRKLLGQAWARGSYTNASYGSTVKASITDSLFFRGGLFHAVGDRDSNYSELFALTSADGSARHRLIADPAQDIHSTSGEAQIGLRFGKGKLRHRLIAGFRGRKRFTESGGSHIENFTGSVTWGVPDPRPRPTFRFGPVNTGQLTQTAFLLGYVGKIEGLGVLNLGVQKARYRGHFHDGRSGAVTESRDDPWLYNATLGIDLTPHLSAYIGTQKGLEDSGAAPENAINRNEQLPATRTRQYDGGVRWKFTGGQLVVNAFEITKPYFAYDAAGAFTEVAHVRHRGIEASLSGRFGDRFHIVAGGMLMRPRVTGPGRDQGVVGKLPTGVPSAFARIDANYRTDLLGGLTPTLAMIYTGKRAVGSRPIAGPGGQDGGRQLMAPGVATFDLGVRRQLRIGSWPASLRAVVVNLFDKRAWKVIAANSLVTDEVRRFNMSLNVDF